MTAKDNHITEDLVEQIAIISYEQIRVRNAELPMPSWTGAGAMTRYQTKQDVLGVLKLVVPVLLDQGWKPPAVEVLPVVNSVEELDALPHGTVIMATGGNWNPEHPELFLKCGYAFAPWMALDPSDRDDGENLEASGAVLRWRCDGVARVIYRPSGDESAYTTPSASPACKQPDQKTETQ